MVLQVPSGRAVQAELLVDAGGEDPHQLVDVDLPDAELLVLQVEVQRGALVLVLQQVLKGLLEVGLLVVRGAAHVLAGVVHLDDFVVMWPVVVVGGVLQDLVREELLVVEDVLQVLLGVVVELR